MVVSHGGDMSNFIKHQKFILAFLVLSLSACITLPGHRVTIDEIDFYLSVKAPNKKIKKFIRFNSEKTKIIYMPENVRIELLVTDKIGKRKLTIEKPGGDYCICLRAKRT